MTTLSRRIFVALGGNHAWMEKSENAHNMHAASQGSKTGS